MQDMRVRWDHVSLAVRDLDAGIRFFTEGLGFEVGFVERGMSGQIASMLGREGFTCDLAQLVMPGGGPRLELIAFRPGCSEAPPEIPVSAGNAHIALRVADLAATLHRLEALGAVPLGAITEFDDCRAVYLSTRFGAFLEIAEPRAAPGGRES